MSRKLGLILMFILFNHFSFSQGCATPTSQDFLASIPTTLLNNSNKIVIRVSAHFVRDDNCTGGMTQSEFQTALQILNNDLSPHNICISLFSTDEICNSSIANGNIINLWSTVVALISNPQAINMYFFPNTNPTCCGTAHSIPSNAFVIGGLDYTSSCIQGSLVVTNTSKILSHEMGHCLGLYHTDENAFGLEFVDGSNCTIAGDKICDTPASPQLASYVDYNSCEWCDSGVDPHGDPYDPDELNIISNSSVLCLQYFTPGQGQRMRDMIINSPVLQPCIVPDNVFLQNEYFSISNVLYAANFSITAGANVKPGISGTVFFDHDVNGEFKTHDNIKLEPGFIAKPSIMGSFHAWIDPNFCGIFDFNNAKISQLTNSYSPLLDSSSWLTTFPAVDGPINSYYHFVKDTIIGLYNYKKIDQTYYNLLNLPLNMFYTNGSSSPLHFYLREDITAKKIYQFNGFTDKLMYDFSLSIGDIHPTDSLLTLTSIDTVLINAGFKQRFIFTTIAGDSVIWIEQVGNIFDPMNSAYRWGTPLARIICSYQNSQLIYDNSSIFGINCLGNITSNSTIASNNESIKIFPIPSKDILNMEFENTLEGQKIISINDLLGHCLLTVKTLSNSLKINISKFSPGIYLLCVENNHIIKNKKIFIE